MEEYTSDNIEVTAEQISKEDIAFEDYNSANVTPFPQVSKSGEKFTYKFIKRIADIVLCLFALVALSPFMLILMIVIRLESPGAVIFKQTRVGKDGKEFEFYKFRSMYQDAEKMKSELVDKNEKGDVIFKMQDDPRITKVGRIIRKTSIDELPQIINIIKGDMSIVGPRPPLPDEVKKYNNYQRQRLSVKGGLTCYWQINGRSNLSFEEWMDLDIKYIQERSLWVDFKILIKTFRAVIKCEGAV